jgi:glucokinase
VETTAPALGIDVGGGSAKIGIVAVDGSILAEDVVTSDPALSAIQLLDAYLDVADRLQASLGLSTLMGVGIGLPGHIAFHAGTTRLCNVRALDDFPIVRHVRERTGLRVEIENDATLAALAEHRFGAGQGSDRFLTVALGTGIGVGFIENGRPFHTSNGTLGDIGHVIVDPSGARSCRQGCRGCLEAQASAIALRERFDALDGHAAGPDGGHGLETLFERARAGDADCARIVSEAARDIAAAMVSWMHIFDPDRIAVAGGVSAAGEVLLAPIRKGVARLAMPAYGAKVDIRAATLGGRAGLVGAAALVLAAPPEQRTQP